MGANGTNGTVADSPEVNRLKNENQSLRLINTMATLLSASQQRDNITSINPLIQNSLFYPVTLNWSLLAYLYKTHGILQTAIDMPVMDSLRGGLDLKCEELSPEELSELADDFEEFFQNDFMDGFIWKRLFGGGALILNTDQDPATPLDETRIGKLKIYAANRWELGVAQGPSQERLMAAGGFGSHVESEFFQFYNVRIHRSRVITLVGKRAPHVIRWQLQGWGMSEFERMISDFNTYLKTNDVIYELLREAKLDVYRFQGLKSMLMTDVGTSKVIDRVQMMNQQKAVDNAVAMDKDDEFEQKQVTFAGLAEMKKQNMISVASVAQMPMAKLFGLSASGFNSGEDDIENYNAKVESDIRVPAKPVLRRLFSLMAAAKFGIAGVKIKVGFKPLRVLGAVEEEQVNTSRQNRIIQVYDRGLADAVETGEELESAKLFAKRLAIADGALPEPPKIEADPPAPEGGDKEEKGGKEK